MRFVAHNHKDVSPKTTTIFSFKEECHQVGPIKILILDENADFYLSRAKVTNLKSL